MEEEEIGDDEPIFLTEQGWATCRIIDAAFKDGMTIEDIALGMGPDYDELDVRMLASIYYFYLEQEENGN